MLRERISLQRNKAITTFFSQCVLLACNVALALVLSGCASTSPQGSLKPDYPDKSDYSEININDFLPAKDSGRIIDTNIRSGIEYLLDNDYKKASQAFNGVLRLDPQNSYIQFLNGLAYHLMAEAGDSSQYEYAKIGYELALKFNGNNWPAAQQLARLFLKTKNYLMAQDYFAQALLYQPDNVEMLYGLAQASYYAHDLETALGAIKRAMALKPDAPEIMSAYSLISAASGQFGRAKAQLAIYSEIESNKPRVKRLTERISDWQKFHENKVFLVASDSSTGSEERQPARDALPADTVKAADDPAEKNKPRMVIVDVILIRTEETETTSKGVNLLDGLFLQFDSKLLEFTRTYTKNMVNSGDATNTTFTNNDNKVVTTNIAIPQIKYNLNIFNVAKDHNEILAKPTLVALEGQKSVFFSGSQLNVAVAGVQTGSLEKIDVGVRLEVMPTFISDNTVVLNVTAGRNFVETGLVGNFNESVKTSKNEVSVNAVLNFGQTLIIGGLREKQTSEVKSGVPFLRDIPVVQYFFSKETTLDFHKSILTILTPRRVSPGVYTSPAGAESGETVSGGTNDQQALKELKDVYTDIFRAEDNMHHIVRHLKKHAVLREFRDTDLYDKPWYGHADSLKAMLARTLSFLYY